jgi:hypothetical protein
VLTPEQLKNLTSDPNNHPLVIQYTVNNSRGNDSTLAPLNIVNPPLSPALPTLQLTVTLPADNSSGSDATGYIPPALKDYMGMPGLECMM